MAEKEYIERNALIAEYDCVHVGALAADMVDVVCGYGERKDDNHEASDGN